MSMIYNLVEASDREIEELLAVFAHVRILGTYKYVF
jgi:hypothetical protein